MQVLPAAALMASSTIVTLGSEPVYLTVSVSGLPSGSIALTYSLDQGDGAGPGTCNTLGTLSFGSLASTRLDGVALTYATTGARNLLLRVYQSQSCAPGTMPPAGGQPVALGATTIQVSTAACDGGLVLEVRPSQAHTLLLH